MNVNVYSAGKLPLLHIRLMGCNRRPFQVNIGPMLRNSYIIHYVTRGRGFYNGTPVETGQGFLMTPGHIEEYHADPADPWELLWIVSEDETMAQLFPACGADPETGVFSYDFVQAASHTAQTLAMLSRRVVSCSELLELFLGVYKHHCVPALQHDEKSRAQTYVEFALDHIRMNYQSDVRVQELTDLLGVSQPYLFRIFKAATGKSPKQYLGDYRLLQAKKLLLETDLTVTEVGASVGYGDVLTFSRFFSAKEKKSPLQYRREMKKETDIWKGRDC